MEQNPNNITIPKNVKINTFGDSADIERKNTYNSNHFIVEKIEPLLGIVKSIKPCRDHNRQKLGIDKILTTMDNKKLHIEEKIRYKNYGDFLIELIGDNRYYLKRSDALGWGLRNNLTDILVYYFSDTNSGYVLNWKKFQRGLLKNLPTWFEYAKNEQFGFSFKKAYNDYKGNKWYSLNIAVPLRELEKMYTAEGGVII